MSFGAEAVARALGLPEIPWRTAKRGLGLFLAVTAITMPVTFGHGIELYAKRESQRLMHTFFDPMLRQLQGQVPAPSAPVKLTPKSTRQRHAPSTRKRR